MRPHFRPQPWFVKAAPIPAPFSETLFGELARNIRALHTKMCYFFNFAWRTHTLLNFKNLPPPFPPPFSSPWKSSESALQLFILSCMLKMHSLRCTNPMHKNKSDSRLCKALLPVLLKWPNKFDLSLEQRIWRLCGNEHGYSDWHIIMEYKGHCFDFEAIRNLWNFYRNRQIIPRKNLKIKEKKFFFLQFFSKFHDFWEILIFQMQF